MATLLIPTFLILFLLHINTGASQAPPPVFKCTSNSTCQSLVGYNATKPTNLSSIITLFQLKNLNTLLGPNNLLPSTSPNYVFPSNHTVKVPIPCRCSKGSGLSDRVPVYQVVKDDGLYVIANQKFGGLLTYEQIQKVNNISDPNLILVGQRLWIPLPCSCDDVDGTRVLHYAHVVGEGSSVAAIAAEFETTSETLMSVNGISDPRKLIAGQVLDVPLKVCSSNVSSNSIDYPLLVANNSYVYTANNCVMCKCDPSTNLTLQCQTSGLKPTKWATCSVAQCSNGLELGNTTTISSCSKSSCAYTGYTSKTILTDLVQDNTCPSGGGTKMNTSGWSLAFALFSIQLLVMFHIFM